MEAVDVFVDVGCQQSAVGQAESEEPVVASCGLYAFAEEELAAAFLAVDLVAVVLCVELIGEKDLKNENNAEVCCLLCSMA